jgi:5-methylcytosine-specific restriction protein A
VCYAWSHGDTVPPVRIQEKGDVVPAPPESQAILFPSEVPVADKEVYFEGAIKRAELSTHERNPKARKECIDHYGAKCVVCGFDFGKVYGEIAEGFIHVHHLTPLAEASGKHEVDFVRDLRPVCANCHAALHIRKPPIDIEELQRLVYRSSSANKSVLVPRESSG